MNNDREFDATKARLAAQQLQPELREWYRNTLNFTTTREFTQQGEAVMHPFEHGFEDLIHQLNATLYDRGLVWDDGNPKIGVDAAQVAAVDMDAANMRDADLVRQYRLFMQKLKPFIEAKEYDPLMPTPAHETALALGRAAAIMQRELHVAIAPLPDAGFDLSKPTPFLKAFQNAVSSPDINPGGLG